MHSPDIRTALRLNHGNASPHLPSEMSEEQQLFTAAGRFRPLVLFLLASMLSLCTSTAPSSLTRWLAGLSSMFPLPPFLLPSILPAQGLFALLSSHTLGYLLSRPDQVIPAHFSGFGCVCIVLYISRLCRQQPWSHVTIFPTDCQHRYPIYRCHWLQVLVTRYIILLSIEATAIMYQDRLCHQDGKIMQSGSKGNFMTHLGTVHDMGPYCCSVCTYKKCRGYVTSLTPSLEHFTDIVSTETHISREQKADSAGAHSLDIALPTKDIPEEHTHTIVYYNQRMRNAHCRSDQATLWRQTHSDNCSTERELARCTLCLIEDFCHALFQPVLLHLSANPTSKPTGSARSITLVWEKSYHFLNLFTADGQNPRTIYRCHHRRSPSTSYQRKSNLHHGFLVQCRNGRTCELAVSVNSNTITSPILDQLRTT
jgi:hypothetical protein